MNKSHWNRRKIVNFKGAPAVVLIVMCWSLCLQFSKVWVLIVRMQGNCLSPALTCFSRASVFLRSATWWHLPLIFISWCHHPPVKCDNSVCWPLQDAALGVREHIGSLMQDKRDPCLNQVRNKMMSHSAHRKLVFVRICFEDHLVRTRYYTISTERMCDWTKAFTNLKTIKILFTCKAKTAFQIPENLLKYRKANFAL